MVQSAAWVKAKGRLLELAQFFIFFLKNPLRAMQVIPNWDLPRIFGFLIFISVPSGLLSGLISRSPIMILWGLILLPLLAFISTGFVTALFYYSFLAVFKTKVDLTRLFLVVVVASIPFMIIRVLVAMIPPLVIIAVAASAILLTVGFVENFNLPRKKVLKMVGVFFAVFFVFWMLQMMNRARSNTDYKDRISPEAVEQLEKEFQ
jgi:hypothetical protein